MAQANNKLENCEVCGTSKAKYTCPKCEVRTCSLTCVNIHKKELECDGIRDKTKFIPLKSFTDLDLLSDYRLLEQIDRKIEVCKRNPQKRYTRQINLPVHLHKLRCAAYHRKVSLLFMPQNFTRHKMNTTYLKWKTNELFWRIEWIFPQAENTKWCMERCLESTRLSTLVEQVLDPVTLLDNKADITELNTRFSLSDKLQFYRATGLTGIKVLLKAEKVKKSSSRFYNIDPTLTLQKNLENKTIIEFPTLYVIMKDHSDMYDILETDEELSDTEDGRRSAKRKRFNNRPDAEKKQEDPVNYFFNDFSDSDNEKTDNGLQNKGHSSDLNITSYDELVKM